MEVNRETEKLITANERTSDSRLPPLIDLTQEPDDEAPGHPESRCPTCNQPWPLASWASNQSSASFWQAYTLLHFSLTMPLRELTYSSGLYMLPESSYSLENNYSVEPCYSSDFYYSPTSTIQQYSSSIWPRVLGEAEWYWPIPMPPPPPV